METPNSSKLCAYDANLKDYYYNDVLHVYN